MKVIARILNKQYCKRELKYIVLCELEDGELYVNWGGMGMFVKVDTFFEYLHRTAQYLESNDHIFINLKSRLTEDKHIQYFKKQGWIHE